MSRRKDSKALVEAMAKVVNNGAGYGRPMTAKQARDLKAEDARLLEERRANSMRRLLAKQFAPCYAAAVVFAVGGICWLIRWRIDSPTAVALAVLVVLVLAAVAVLVGRRTKKWKGRVHLAAWLASSWLLWTAGTGPSWWAPISFILGTWMCSARWWQVHRIPYPPKPNRDEPRTARDDSVPALWSQYIADQGGALPSSRLTGQDMTKPNCEQYMINLVPGKQTITSTIAKLELIAGGLSKPIKQVVLEPHEDGNPNHMHLTVVQVSPIEKTVPYAGARITGPRRNILEVGPYADGDGMAPWRMWHPGEEPMTGSWLSGFIVAGTGMGKSRLMELLAAGYMASGSAVVWFADPQGGASSAALKEYADWYVDAEGTPVMLAALERIADARELENSDEGWTRFDPSPERPGIIVFLDECHETFSQHAKRWAKLARKSQKLGIGFVGLTQDASLSSFVEEALRAALLANAIIMRTESNIQGRLIPGIDVNPLTLPDIAGFGYVMKRAGVGRTAPFRSEYLAKPKHWFAQYPMPRLDPLSANAAGEVYQGRRETQAELHEANRLKVAAMRGGTYQPQLEEPDLDDEGVTEPRAFQVVRFPSAVAPPERPARERVLVAVAQGITRTAEIQREVGLSKSRCAEVLAQLLESHELERPTAGVYAIAGSASTPER